VFHKNVDSAKDLLKVFGAYGIDAETVTELRERDCQTIEIRERDTSVVYRIPFNLFLEKSVIRALGRYGPRHYCRLSWWTKTPAGGSSPSIQSQPLVSEPSNRAVVCR
jgi:hypothetical protein